MACQPMSDWWDNMFRWQPELHSPWHHEFSFVPQSLCNTVIPLLGAQVCMRSRALKHAGRVGWYETTGTVGLQLLPPQKEMSFKDGLSWRKWARRVWFCQSRVQKCETASENDSVTLFSHLKTFLFSSYFKNTSVWGKNTILVFILEKYLLTPLVFVKPEDHVILHDLRMFQDSLVFQWK